MRIDLLLTPLPLDRAGLEDKAVVVIDVLRSTTSICAMLQGGARGVIPTAGPGQAVDMWGKLGSDMAVLAGERNGVKVENFAFGNSPAEFTDLTVRGKYVVTTTTNGTPVFGQAAGAAVVLTGALVNMSALARRVAGENRDTVIVCSGREGGFSIEDTLCGGMLIDRLKQEAGGPVVLNDAASLALLLFETNRASIRESIETGEHARFLKSIGFGGDVELATRVDSMPVVPVLRDGRLVLDQG